MKPVLAVMFVMPLGQTVEDSTEQEKDNYCHCSQLMYCNRTITCSIVGAKIWNSIPESYGRLPKHIFKKKIQALLFVTLEPLDSYADASTLTSEIKKAS